MTTLRTMPQPTLPRCHQCGQLREMCRQSWCITLLMKKSQQLSLLSSNPAALTSLRTAPQKFSLSSCTAQDLRVDSNEDMNCTQG